MHKSCPKWEFGQCWQKTTNLKKLQTIKNKNRHETKIYFGLLINRECLKTNVSY